MAREHVASLADAFGASGHVYIKNKDNLEDVIGWGGSSKAGTPSGSGRNTTDRASTKGRQRGAQRGAGTMASDLIPVKNRQSHSATTNANPAHQGQKPPTQPAAVEQLKTPEVKKLEKLIARVQAVVVGKERWQEEEDAVASGSGGAEEGCFCQARLHALSTYTPSCSRCGLVLCSLQPAYLPCPSCSTTLLTALTKTRLLTKLDAELNLLLSRQRKELEDREEEEKKVWLARSGGGAFPTLASGLSGGGGTHNANGSVMDSRQAMRTGIPFVPPPVSRTVISIGPSASASANAAGKGKPPIKGFGTKGATTKIVTYTKPSIGASSSSSSSPSSTTTSTAKPKPSQTSATKITRPPTKSTTSESTSLLSRARAENEAWREKESRPWGDMNARVEGWEVSYVPVGRGLDDVGGDGLEGTGTGKKKKGKGKGQGQGQVPGQGQVDGHPIGRGWLLG